MDNKNKLTMNESMFSAIDQIRQDSKDVRDFVKNVFKDREFKKMSSDKEFIKYLKSIYEGTVLDEEQVKFSSRDSNGNITTTVREETINEAIKGKNNKTGETFEMVIGSDKKNREGEFEVTIRISYSSRISSYTFMFDKSSNLIAIKDYGYSMDGKFPDMSGGGSVKSVRPNPRETITQIAKVTSPAFAKKIYQHVKKVNESVNEGKKRFKRQDGIGKAKYTISYHDGKKKHKDGSDFFDIKIFKNKKDLSDFVGTLAKQGYKLTRESVNEGLKHNDMYTMLDIAAGYSSTQDQAASQMWYDEQDLYDYLKSDHIPKKYHKKFYNDVKRRFKKIKESVNEACWDTHKQVGTKIKGGKRVPNCVPKSESVNERYTDFIKAKNLTDIIKLSKQKKNATFYVTDDNNSRIGTFYLKNGKFAKATTANANYDLQNSKTSLKDRSDVIYKYKIDESTDGEKESVNEGTDIYLNNRIQVTKFSGGKDGKLIQINAPKIKGSGDHIVMKIDDFIKMLKKSSNLLKQVQESVNEASAINRLNSVQDAREKMASHIAFKKAGINKKDAWFDKQEKTLLKKSYQDLEKLYLKLGGKRLTIKESVNESKYNYKADALTAYFKGKIDAKELDKIARDDFKSGIATKKELSNFLSNKFTQSVMSDTYGIPAGTLIKRVRGLMKFAEGKDDGVPQGYNPMVEDKSEIKGLVKKVGNKETKFYDVLSAIEKKYGKQKYRIWLEKSLKDFGVNPKHYDYRTNAGAEEKLYQLGK